MTYAPIRDTCKCPIAFTDFGGIPCVVLPSEPSNWAETRADLQDWASEMGAKAAAQHAQAQAILLKAEPAGEFSFHGLLAVYVKRKGDKDFAVIAFFEQMAWQGRGQVPPSGRSQPHSSTVARGARPRRLSRR